MIWGKEWNVLVLLQIQKYIIYRAENCWSTRNSYQSFYSLLELQRVISIMLENSNKQSGKGMDLRQKITHLLQTSLGNSICSHCGKHHDIRFWNAFKFFYDFLIILQFSIIKARPSLRGSRKQTNKKSSENKMLIYWLLTSKGVF